MAREQGDEVWRAYERSLLNKIAYRERELAELNEDYLELEQRYNGCLAYLRRVWARFDLERANRKLAEAAND